MATIFPNVWHHRRVAESSAKACWICYKPSSSVLITPNQKDFFYICVGHLKDRAFCQPDAEEATALAAKKKKEEMDKEIEIIKKEYEAKLKRKKDSKDKKSDKDEKQDSEAKKADEAELSKLEKERDDKVKALSQEDVQAEDGPRIYSLHKNFYQMRIDRIHNAEMAKRNRERLKTPTAFPSVPRDGL